MEKSIIDERTGWKYELAGDYYLPVGTRFEDADPDNECGTSAAMGLQLLYRRTGQRYAGTADWPTGRR